MNPALHSIHSGWRSVDLNYVKRSYGLSAGATYKEPTGYNPWLNLAEHFPVFVREE